MKKYLIAALVALSLVFANVNTSNADDVTLLKRVDEFAVILDQSGSMYMKDAHKHVKMAVAKESIKNILEALPELPYESSLALSSSDKTLIKHGEMDKEKMIAAVSKVKDEQPVFGRFTSLWSAIDKSGKEFCSNSRKSAILLVTDGDSNRGENPIETVKKLYAANPKAIVHILSLADTPEGKNIIDGIAKLNDKTVVVPACELLDKKKAEAFALSVLFGEYTPIEVKFAFDSYAVDGDAVKKALAELGMLYDAAVVQGFACTIGDSKYNARLSLRRACALADAITANAAIGSGESTFYPNKADNRRALIFLK